tara:strand:- start:1127 stop:2572 length:1446 start_codon:yes stop_codon:yes gene_type:complete
MHKKQLKNILDKFFCIFFIVFFTVLLVFYIKTKVLNPNLSLINIINITILILNFFFWIWVLFSKNNLRPILLTSYFSVVLAIFVSEFFISKINKNAKFQYFIERNKEQNKIYDTRSKFEIYKDLKKTQIISPIYRPFNQLKTKQKITAKIDNIEKEILILSGVSNRKTIVCNENGEYLIYLSDRYGFNNPDDLWESSSDAVILGDSNVLGECVPYGDDISSILRNENKKSIINLGMGGNGPLLQLATLKEYQPLTNSNKIIWVYYEGNDLLDLYNEKKNKILLNYFDREFKQDLYKIQNSIDKKILGLIEQQYKNYQKNTYISFFLLSEVREKLKNFLKGKNSNQSNLKFKYNVNIPFVYQNIANINSENPYSSNIKMYEKILNEVRKFSIKNNTKNYFVYLPAVARFSGEFENNEDLFARREILNLAEKFNFELIDIYAEFFKNQKNPLEFYPYNGKRRHFNSKGYEAIADIINKKIYKN